LLKSLIIGYILLSSSAKKSISIVFSLLRKLQRKLIMTNQ